MNKSLAAAAAAAILVFSTSCGRPEQPDSPTPSSSAAYAMGDRINPSKANIDPILGACSIWKDVKLPLSLKLRQPSSLSGSAQLTMERNKSIHISVRAIGFEVASIMVTQDSVFAMDKLHKRWFGEATANLLKGFPATVGDLQDLLLGKVFLPGNVPSDSPFELIELKQEGSEGLCLLNPTLTDKRLNCQFLLQLGGTPSLLGFTASGGVDSDMNIIYDDIETAPGMAGRVAGTLTMSGKMGKRNLDATLTLKLDKAKWNQGVSPTWKQPKGYTRISASQLLSSFSSL